MTSTKYGKNQDIRELTLEQHDRRTKGCMHVATVKSTSQKRYGRGRSRLIKCDCWKYRPADRGSP